MADKADTLSGTRCAYCIMARALEWLTLRPDRYTQSLSCSKNSALLLANRVESIDTLAQHDINFYMHELKESAFMKRGLDVRSAHEATLQWQGISYKPGYEAQLYVKDVIQKYWETFNPAARKAAGLE